MMVYLLFWPTQLVCVSVMPHGRLHIIITDASLYLA